MMCFFDDVDFADDILRAIEKDYGRGIARIPMFERGVEPFSFNIKVIFTDFKLLEGTIHIVPYFGLATVKIEGIYY